MSWDNFNELGDIKAQIEASKCFHGILSVSQFMPLGSIGEEKTEPSVKKEELASVSHLWEDEKCNLSESLGKVNADLVSIAWWQNLIILHTPLLLLLF
jgi:hypothetical protein